MRKISVGKLEKVQRFPRSPSNKKIEIIKRKLRNSTSVNGKVVVTPRTGSDEANSAEEPPRSVTGRRTRNVL